MQNLPRRRPPTDFTTGAGKAKGAVVALVLVAAAVLLLVVNAGRVARTYGLAGEPGTATPTECHPDGGASLNRHPFQCHGVFRGVDGTVNQSVVFEDPYQHAVGKPLQARYDGTGAVSIEDVAMAGFAPVWCALALLLLAVAAMVVLLVAGVAARTAWRSVKYPLIATVALVVAALLTTVFTSLLSNG